MLVNTTNSGCNIYFRILIDSINYRKDYRTFRKYLIKKCEKSDIFREKLKQIYNLSNLPDRILIYKYAGQKMKLHHDIDISSDEDSSFDDEGEINITMRSMNMEKVQSVESTK